MCSAVTAGTWANGVHHQTIMLVKCRRALGLGVAVLIRLHCFRHAFATNVRTLPSAIATECIGADQFFDLDHYKWSNLNHGRVRGSKNARQRPDGTEVSEKWAAEERISRCRTH